MGYYKRIENKNGHCQCQNSIPKSRYSAWWNGPLSGFCHFTSQENIAGRIKKSIVCQRRSYCKRRTCFEKTSDAGRSLDVITGAGWCCFCFYLWRLTHGGLQLYLICLQLCLHSSWSVHGDLTNAVHTCICIDVSTYLEKKKEKKSKRFSHMSFTLLNSKLFIMS